MEVSTTTDQLWVAALVKDAKLPAGTTLSETYTTEVPTYRFRTTTPSTSATLTEPSPRVSLAPMITSTMSLV
jgi:hypothetical protein